MTPRIASVALLVGVSLVFGQGGSWTARVVEVQDGDTITILREEGRERVRLWGIDCPEKRQLFGTRAKELTRELSMRGGVTLVPHGKDRYGRLIAEVVTSDDRNVGQELVRAGLAWWYRKYAAADGTLEQLEREAKASRRGLWGEQQPTAPWEFRNPLHRRRQLEPR